MQEIVARLPCLHPPTWALLEQRLLEVLGEAPWFVLERYVAADGSLLWPTRPDHEGVDGLDDAYESFHNWPLLCLIRSDGRLLQACQREFEAITRQFARYPTGFGRTMVVHDYEGGYDWFHQGEGYRFFYDLCLADPTNRAYIQRACHYAGYYLNEHDLLEPNYDPRHRIIRGPYVGSTGPNREVFGAALRRDLPRVYGRPWPQVLAWWIGVWGLPFQDVPGVSRAADLEDPERAEAMVRALRERLGSSDTVVNLAATSMVANAFLLTGAPRYCDWVLEYVSAWMERARANRGIVPDNVGPNGIVGEHLGGKWYGGWYGWTFPCGWHSVGPAVAIGAENATRLTGDVSFMEFLRWQIEILEEQAREVDGRLYVPYRYGDPGWYGYGAGDRWVLRDERGDVLWRNGWFDFRPADPTLPAHLWAMTLEPADRARVRRWGRAEVTEDIPPEHGKDLGGHEAAWLAFLDGEAPGYPEEILRYNLGPCARRLLWLQEDREDPTAYSDAYLQVRNPVVLEALTQLVLGAPLPIYNGGLVIAQVRYWDPDRRRPGLPPGVVALVDRIELGGIRLHVINLRIDREAVVILEAGAGAEHDFTEVRLTPSPTAGKSGPAEGEVRWEPVTVQGPWLILRLRPLSQARLELGMRRWVRPASARPPW
jgi:hypothetical protein